MSKKTFEPLEIILKKQGRVQEDIDKIKETFEYAYSKHEGQYRASEEPYIIHPTEVAKILAEFKADTPTIMAALLHDVLEDTPVEAQEIEEKFIATVACKAAVKANMRLEERELIGLLDQLMVLENPFTCPHGRPTAMRLTKTEIEKKFNRR